MKTYPRQILIAIALFSLLLASCGATSQNPKASSISTTSGSMICMENDEPDRILGKLRDHTNESSTSKIYVLFESSICRGCPLLRTKIKNVKLDAELIYVNIDFTWAFILSQHIGVRGVPSLVVFIQGTPKFVRPGNGSILEYLHGNALQEKE